MKKLLLYSLLLLSTILFAQNVKKEILLDENDKPISAAEFKKKVTPPGNKHTYSITETDSVIFGHLVPFRQLGILTKHEKEVVIKELERLSGRNIDTTQIVIINFFTKKSTENRGHGIYNYAFDKKYKKFIKGREDIAQFYITEQTFDFKKDFLLEDKNAVIRNSLFKHPFYVNYIIIKPSGQFYRQVSEYRQWEIPAIVEADWGINEAKSNLITK